jgi:hypothetical protein
MKNFVAVVGLVAIHLASPARSLAADPRVPDWPCVQAKVPDISVVAVWSGPPIDDIGDRWQDNTKVRDLVTRLAARRVLLEDAEKAIAEFVTGSADEKQEKAKLLFAGLFTVLNRDRSDVMNGIERFTRRQRVFADRIRSDTSRLRELQGNAEADQGATKELRTQVEWNTRIFEERRKTSTYACEVPVLIEQRLFALARAIQQSLE